ncbi:unnamed protein product [Urochloa decumbens]|uniref:KIB1-4 beta-propeller domain-containing protein n=1 Tax=Urochloa decumbens TaxID=240449 RepID=A0ABC9DWJ5_9POAL
MGRMAGGGWSSLSADLLHEISGRLSSDADHLHIHQVCTHWRASTSSPAAWRPWVVAGCGGSGSRLYPIRDYSLRLPLDGAQRVDVGALPAGLPYCCGASQGWLALVDHYGYPTRLVLWEPLSNTEISLPCLENITLIVLSGDPLTSSSDWVAIAGQVQGPVRQTTVLWRPGDATWTMLNDQETYEIDTVVFHEGKAYYIDIMGTIAICDLNSGTDPKSIQIFLSCLVVPNLCKCDQHHRQRGVHLVSCKGELLVVVLYWGNHPSPAEVYKPVWASNQRLELHERVMNLGDHSLFLGRGDTFALSAKEFPAIKRNCIYYADNPHQKRYWISVFHLDSDVVEKIPYPEELKEDRTNLTTHAWFCPRTPVLKQQ